MFVHVCTCKTIEVSIKIRYYRLHNLIKSPPKALFNVILGFAFQSKLKQCKRGVKIQFSY